MRLSLWEVLMHKSSLRTSRKMHGKQFLWGTLWNRKLFTTVDPAEYVIKYYFIRILCQPPALHCRCYDQSLIFVSHIFVIGGTLSINFICLASTVCAWEHLNFVGGKPGPSHWVNSSWRCLYNSQGYTGSVNHIGLLDYQGHKQ